MKRVREESLRQELMESSAYLDQFSFDVGSDAELFMVPAGEYIIKEGVRPEYLFYLCRGRARLFMTLSNGDVALIDFFSAPCFIGEMELISDDREVRAVQAIEDSYLLALPLRRYRDRLLNDACFLRGLCRLLGVKNYRNTVTFIRNQTFPLINRLAAFILMTEDQGVIRKEYAQVAEYFGVSYRHLLYVFAELVERGYLRKEKKSYVILDRAALMELSRDVEVR